MQSPRAPHGGSDLVGLGPGMKIYVYNKHLSWFCWLGRFGERFWIVGSICPFADLSIFQVSPSNCLLNLWTQIHRKNFSMFSWFIRSELECNSANSTQVPSLEGSWWRPSVPKVKLDTKAKSSGKNPFRDGADFSTTRHPWELSLCTPYDHISPHNFHLHLEAHSWIIFSAGTSQPSSHLHLYFKLN